MANTSSLGFEWKPTGWRDGEQVPRTTLPDGTLAEAMAALGYGWDSVNSIWRKILVDASGNQQVVLSGSGTVTANQGTANTAANAWPTKIVDSGGVNVAAVTAANAQKVDGSGVTQPVSQSGTWTVQPGNTANTTAWKVDGSAVTQPVSVAAALDVSDRSARLVGRARLTDDTNLSTIKAASTAAAATDTALVVAVSPNNTVAATQSGTWTVQPGNTPNTTAWLMSQIGSRLDSANLCVTGTAAAGTGVTITLPAVASQFHYISQIQIVRFAAAALTAAATPVLVTTTNLPGSPVFSFDASAAAQGTTNIQQIAATTPIKSSVVNTATTIVAPATTSTIWRVTAWYYAAV